MFLYRLGCLAVPITCPPTGQRSSAQLEITQELPPQTFGICRCVYTTAAMMQAEFEKLAQDVYTAAFEECLLVS